MLREVDMSVFEGRKAGNKCNNLSAGLFVKYVQLNERSKCTSVKWRLECSEESNQHDSGTLTNKE
jgi:hypothetical protein